MIGRAAVREHVFVPLFESIFNSPDDMDGVADAYFEGLDSPMDAEDSAYIEARFRAVEEKLPEIDRLIDEHSTGWKIGRIGKVELSILRLALYELKYDEDIPDMIPERCVTASWAVWPLISSALTASMSLHLLAMAASRFKFNLNVIIN